MSDYNTTDIALEVERMKKDPHVIDMLKAKDNRHNKHKGQKDADDIEQLLPSGQQQLKTAEHLTSMLNTTSRAGAGGTKAGLVGLRPSGGVAAAKFIEDNVGTGRIEKEYNPADDNSAIIPESKQRPADVKKPSVVIYDRCMDCMKPVPEGDVWPNMVIIPDYSKIPDNPPADVPMTIDEKAHWLEFKKQSEEDRARWMALRLHPGEVLCYIFHASCVISATQQAKRRRLVIDAKGTTQGEKELRERGKRISQQVFDYIKQARYNPDSDIFHGDAATR